MPLLSTFASASVRGFRAPAISGGNDQYTKILLHMDGSSGGTTFTDSNIGGSSHTWTAHSATTNTSTVKFGTASLNCGAGAGYIDTPDHADFALGTGNFTVDCWFYRSGGDGTNRYMGGQLDSGGGDRSWSLQLNTSNVVVALLVGSGGSPSTSVTGTTAITTTGWHHAAFVRTGNTLKLFVDGVQEGGDVSFSATVTDSSSNISIGRPGAFSGQLWNGFIDEFRLSVGVARWTANFTPPAQAYF